MSRKSRAYEFLLIRNAQESQEAFQASDAQDYLKVASLNKTHILEMEDYVLESRAYQSAFLGFELTFRRMCGLAVKQFSERCTYYGVRRLRRALLRIL